MITPLLHILAHVRFIVEWKRMAHWRIFSNILCFQIKCCLVSYPKIIQITFTLIQQPMTELKSSWKICREQLVSFEYLVGMPCDVQFTNPLESYLWYLQWISSASSCRSCLTFAMFSSLFAVLHLPERPRFKFRLVPSSLYFFDIFSKLLLYLEHFFRIVWKFLRNLLILIFLNN